MDEVWILGEDGVTPKVHPTAQVDVGAEIVGDFATHYLTENGRRVPMFVKKPIKGSFDFLGVPDPLRNNAPPPGLIIYWFPVQLGESVVL